MIRIQAELAGIPVVQRRVAQSDFELEFKKTVSDLKKDGVTGMVVGDIYLEPHKEWVDRTCAELGIIPDEPLWGMNTEKIMQEFLALGFETIVASGDQKLIKKEWILKANDLDVCGESGEFHTFVTRGPMFSGSIDIKRSDVVARDGF